MTISFLIRMGMLCVCTIVGTSYSLAQTAPAPFGGVVSGDRTRAGVMGQPLAASGDAQSQRHKDFTGKLCLDVRGFARAHLVNKNLFDHVVSVQNSCPQQISLSVCYYQSDECVSLDVPGYDHKEVVLGILPAQSDFRFQFREKF